MIGKYVPSDAHGDDFYEQFMERRVPKLNNPKKPLQTIQFFAL